MNFIKQVVVGSSAGVTIGELQICFHDAALPFSQAGIYATFIKNCGIG